MPETFSESTSALRLSNPCCGVPRCVSASSDRLKLNHPSVAVGQCSKGRRAYAPPLLASLLPLRRTRQLLLPLLLVLLPPPPPPPHACTPKGRRATAVASCSAPTVMHKGAKLSTQTPVQHLSSVVLPACSWASSQLGVQVMRVCFYVSIDRIVGAPQSGPPRPLAAACSLQGALSGFGGARGPYLAQHYECSRRSSVPRQQTSAAPARASAGSKPSYSSTSIPHRDPIPMRETARAQGLSRSGLKTSRLAQGNTPTWRLRKAHSLRLNQVGRKGF